MPRAVEEPENKEWLWYEKAFNHSILQWDVKHVKTNYSIRKFQCYLHNSHVCRVQLQNLQYALKNDTKCGKFSGMYDQFMEIEKQNRKRSQTGCVKMLRSSQATTINLALHRIAMFY